MHLRLLGPVEVHADGQWVRAGPAKRSGVLAVLAMSPNVSVSQATLIHRVWGGDPPSAVRGTLYAHMNRLRKLFDSSTGVRLDRAEGEGYRLDIAENDIDAFAMRQLLWTAHSYTEAEQYDSAVESFRQADALWRDEPLRHIQGDWTQRVRGGLWRERVAGLEGRFDVELRLGRHREVLTELTDVVEAHPRSETLARHLLLALYRCDQQAEALEAFRRVDRRLRDEYGIEPGPSLRETHGRILAQDPQLAAAPEAAVTITPWQPDTGGSTVVPRQLPPQAAGFVGREDTLQQLSESSRRPHPDAGSSLVVILSGMAGAGKTALAVRWAHQITDQFTDGQLFVDMRGFGTEEPRTAAEALALLLRALGIREIPEDTDERVALYRSVTAGQRLLVLLDNVADPAQLRPLLPASPESLVVATSRHSLSSLVAGMGAQRVHIDVFSFDEARSLSRELLKDMPSSESELDELAKMCGHLPLALRIAAANITEHGYGCIPDYIAELPEPERLSGLSVDDDPAMTVRWAFDASFHRLSDTAKAVFRSTAILPGTSFSADAVAALNDDFPPSSVVAALRTLVAAHLVGQAGQGRYVLHDLLRLYAKDRFESDVADKHASRMALYRWYLRTCRAADAVLYPNEVRLPLHDESPALDFADRDAALAWLENEYDNIWEVMQRAAHDGAPSAAWSLADAMISHIASRADLHRWDEIATLGLRLAEQSGDERATAAMRHLGAGRAAFALDYDTALSLYAQGLEDARAAGDLARESTIVSRMANASARAGRLDDAISYGRQAVELAGRISSSAEATAMSILGVVCMVSGRLTESADNFERALRNSGTHLRATTGNIAVAYKALGRLTEATEYARQSQRLCRESGGRGVLVTITGNLAEILSLRGEDEEALSAAREALDITESEELRGHRPDALTNMAIAERYRDPSRAAELATEALRELCDTDASSSYCEALLALSQALLQTGDGHAARQRALEVRELARRDGFRDNEGKGLVATAEADLALGDSDTAADTAYTAIDHNRETGNRLAEARALVVLARTTSDADLAQSLLNEAQDIFTVCGAREAKTTT